MKSYDKVCDGHRRMQQQLQNVDMALDSSQQALKQSRADLKACQNGKRDLKRRLREMKEQRDYARGCFNEQQAAQVDAYREAAVWSTTEIQKIRAERDEAHLLLEKMTNASKVIARERDEAKKVRRQWKTAWEGTQARLKEVILERDEARAKLAILDKNYGELVNESEDAKEEAAAAKATRTKTDRRLEKVTKERDEALARIRELEGIAQVAVDDHFESRHEQVPSTENLMDLVLWDEDILGLDVVLYSGKDKVYYYVTGSERIRDENGIVTKVWIRERRTGVTSTLTCTLSR